MKNAFSIQILRIPNITLSRHRERKGTDRSPLNAEFLGRNDIGPVKKNLDIPNELANMLKKNLIKGRASLMLRNVEPDDPNKSSG